ncbi:UDP-3-O-(3-hydroxymyristoyl)glucosamine N-acyltransferase [Roseobacter sinensis]|uniref:UDP-3-O-(3-hydroxymyristoyl)glucosamine N-acyltransferase n=1 Tax=Roseobacter sinensis TaxID=2931391 RepID=A0ABT3BB90_9RHOB|nr:UDP-3-O-(3-hydroxymyristoyl)glucosamine N-acyltransferase [Roseobacter sp. WL0113]MCV3270851.1 UDP-3-O-(3-hydroxymyristoyl)glucosamine N-acyltransferase [Roseobacter sp. WL0113]
MPETSHSVEEIAAALAADAFGDTSLRVARAAEPQTAGPDDLAIATNQTYADALSAGAAQVGLLWEGADWAALGLKAAIIPTRPRYAMSGITKLMDPGQGFGEGIHPSAVIDPTAELGEHVSVGPLTVIGPGAKIGAGSVIGPQCFIGWDAELGEGAFLREGVGIGARVRIGARFIAQPGARIGGDGFSYVTPDRSAVEATRSTLGDQQDTQAQSWTRIHSLGAVTLGDDVEIGMNSVIDCGTIRDTVVGDRTKIDNLVHIGHNCVIGTDCLICGCVGIAGSVDIGNYVILGGQVGVSDNIFIGDGVIAGGGSKILSNVPAGRSLLGYPAVKMETHVESYKATRRLPRLMRDVAALQKAVFKSGGND